MTLEGALERDSQLSLEEQKVRNYVRHMMTRRWLSPHGSRHEYPGTLSGIPLVYDPDPPPGV